MSAHSPLPGTEEPLQRASDALDRLDRLCCDPGRSPRMAALRTMIDGITAATTGFTGESDEADEADEIVHRLEEAGAAIGRLEIGCCAPNRLPLYATMLEELTKVRTSVDAAAGRGH